MRELRASYDSLLGTLAVMIVSLIPLVHDGKYVAVAIICGGIALLGMGLKSLRSQMHMITFNALIQ